MGGGRGEEGRMRHTHMPQEGDAAKMEVVEDELRE